MNNNNIDYIFKNTNTPLLVLFILLNKDLSDENIVIILKFFLQYNDMLPLKVNIIKLLKNNNNSIELINKYYYIINKQIKIIPFIKKIKEAYPNIFFWKKNICDQIDDFKNKFNLLLSYNDCSKGNITFTLKLRMGYNYFSKEFIENEMIDRLLKTKKLFQLPFFVNNSIILMNIEQFLDLTYENKINYMEYIFMSCFKKLLSYINYLEIYNIYRTELENLLNPNTIDIIETTDDIDINTSDIEFM